MDTDLYRRYRFFHEHAGYIVGRAAECALTLARAEHVLEMAQDRNVALIEWMDDDEPYEHGFLNPEQVQARFDSNEWSGPYGCVLTIDGEACASLWGIVVGQAGTRDPYCRVVAAELASECVDELWEAMTDESEVVPERA